ncbi:3'(2'),5'-bisphosphate nucleotidase CysQ [Methylocapsa palsarum]|uniref:Myo-inositol-1(Or 4)-monophosphatase n=1 Tax=Methylocapsa palsarum TaxID=1612308 RepID=A0A1I3WD56_9HYPH|nr:3'(2'),5'-bisphosphate nucleotidase CysQ [Methylocapsa palsarum]SFK04717.1 myo-inositol-1(or 4)-monophosphatase [Methylocapsa palsarum]
MLRRILKVWAPFPFGWKMNALVSISSSGALAASIVDAAQTAGDMALDFFRPGGKTSATIFHKQGGSPVTEADYLVDRFLKERLESLCPDAAWLSEESEDTAARLENDLVLVVDPIDGTRGFLNGHRTWAVSIALVKDGRPLIGVVHAPALAETYVATHLGGARLNGALMEVSRLGALQEGAKVAAPASFAAELRRCGLQFDLQPRIPSLAMRIAFVASGALDAGFASENAHDWDIAAADLILQEAGGRLAGLDGRAIVYNRKETRHGVLTAAPRQIHAEVNAAARCVKGAPLA